MFSDQVVLITGAGRGIGAAAARMFAERGACVLVNDLDEDTCLSVVERLRAGGAQAHAVPGNVTDSTFADLAIDAAYRIAGGLNVLVNNAGFTWDGMLHKMPDDQWYEILEVHATAPFRIIRSVARHWRAEAKAEIARQQSPTKPRCIINVSSTSGLHGRTGQVNYATAKMGIIGLTKTVAREWGAFGIRCNAVAFGFIDTRLTRPKELGDEMAVGEHTVTLGIPTTMRDAAFSEIPLGRPGTVEEAAGGIVLLASPLAAYVTGHTLEVTGGMGI